jgi:peroxiredoxin
MDVSVFERTKLLNIKTGNSENLSFGDADYTLLVLLSAGDCPNCLKEKEIWAELINTFGSQKLKVIGVLSRTSLEEAETFIDGFNFPFPVFLDNDSRLSQMTKLPQLTPYKVLLKNGEVILAQGPSPDTKVQQAYGEKIKSKLSNEQ